MDPVYLYVSRFLSLNDVYLNWTRWLLVFIDFIVFLSWKKNFVYLSGSHLPSCQLHSCNVRIYLLQSSWIKRFSYDLVARERCLFSLFDVIWMIAHNKYWIRRQFVGPAWWRGPECINWLLFNLTKQKMKKNSVTVLQRISVDCDGEGQTTIEPKMMNQMSNW